jgi:hypothetical protein
MHGLKHRFRAIAKEDQRQMQVRRVNLARQGKQELLHLQRATHSGRQVDSKKGADHRQTGSNRKTGPRVGNSHRIHKQLRGKML